MAKQSHSAQATPLKSKRIMIALRMFMEYGRCMGKAMHFKPKFLEFYVIITIQE